MIDSEGADEDIEKVRQAIMRFQELLKVMRAQLEAGEQAYTALFSSLPPSDVADVKEKDRQWKLAETMVADLSPLRKAVIQMRFDARNLERDFEQLYDNIASTS